MSTLDSESQVFREGCAPRQKEFGLLSGELPLQTTRCISPSWHEVFLAYALSWAGLDYGCTSSTKRRKVLCLALWPNVDPGFNPSY